MTFRALQTTFKNPDYFVDAFDDDPREGPDGEYDEFACLDANKCSNDGGCEYLTCCGVTRCKYCGTVVA
jgi:hypothetical protein